MTATAAGRIKVLSRRKFLGFLGAVCSAPALAKVTQRELTEEQNREEDAEWEVEYEYKPESQLSSCYRTGELSDFEKPIVFFERNGVTRRASYEELFDGSVNGWDSFVFEEELQ